MDFVMSTVILAALKKFWFDFTLHFFDQFIAYYANDRRYSENSPNTPKKNTVTVNKTE